MSEELIIRSIRWPRASVYVNSASITDALDENGRQNALTEELGCVGPDELIPRRVRY